MMECGRFAKQSRRLVEVCGYKFNMSPISMVV